MRILIVGENHRAEIRGRTIGIHGLARALRDRDHDVTMVQAAIPEHRMQIEGVRMRYIGMTRKSRYPLRMGFLSTRGYDIVHSNDESGAWLAARSRMGSMPLVAQIQPPNLKRARESFWQANWRWRYIGMAARLAPVVLAPSQWLAEQITEVYGLAPEKVFAVDYGLNPRWFEAFRAPDSASGGPVRVVLVNMKGADVALRAFAKAAPEGARIELYGTHKELPEYEALARSLGVESRVEFAGFVPNDELAGRVAGADLLIHPARGEGFGQVLAEAAALGMPALASSVDAIPTVVLDGKTGLLAPVDDVDAFAAALSRLIEQPELRRSLGAAARVRAKERWRWEAAAKQVEEQVYLPLLERLGKTRR